MRLTEPPLGTFVDCLRRFGADEAGATAVEYVVLASMIFLIVLGVANYTDAMAGLFNGFATHFG